MLKHRLITAAILLPVALAAVWFLPLVWLYVLFSVVALIAAAEWTHLMGMTGWTPGRIAYLIVSAVILAALWPVRHTLWQWLALLATGWWFLVAVLIFRYPAGFDRRPPVAALAFAGQLLWAPTVLCLIFLRGQLHGREKLIYEFALIWAADTGAYVVGRSLGSRKLAPRLSPGKTREGAIGGALFCLIWAACGGEYAFRASLTQLGWLVLVSFIAGLTSIVGDLGISLFKRLSGLKNSGTLLPGHGGVLDRLDSLLAAAPVFTLGIWMAGLVR